MSKSAEGPNKSSSSAQWSQPSRAEPMESLVVGLLREMRASRWLAGRPANNNNRAPAGRLDVD